MGIKNNMQKKKFYVKKTPWKNTTLNTKVKVFIYLYIEIKIFLLQNYINTFYNSY